MLYCKKKIVKNDKIIENEEVVDESFDSIVISKVRKIATQVKELKILKKTNTKRFDEIIDEIDEVLKNYKNQQRIKKEWKLYNNIFKIDINTKNKTVKIEKTLPFREYTSYRYYYEK